MTKEEQVKRPWSHVSSRVSRFSIKPLFCSAGLKLTSSVRGSGTNTLGWNHLQQELCNWFPGSQESREPVVYHWPNEHHRHHDSLARNWSDSHLKESPLTLLPAPSFRASYLQEVEKSECKATFFFFIQNKMTLVSFMAVTWREILLLWVELQQFLRYWTFCFFLPAAVLDLLAALTSSTCLFFLQTKSFSISWINPSLFLTDSLYSPNFPNMLHLH